jgi:DNA-binding IclR family transcriptional regulator
MLRMMPSGGRRACTRSIQRSEAFREGEEALSLAALAEKTGFYKSTILRLTASLERFGYLARELGGLYRLGPSLWRLGSL